jgi:AraC-like DNA-binding protein
MFYQLSHLGTSDYFKKESGVNFSYPPHLHQSFELVIITSGSMDVTVDGEVYTLASGQGVFIFPNQIHSLTSSDSEHILFLFSPQFIQAYWTEKSDSIPDNNVVDLDEYTKNVLMQLTEESSKFEIKGVLYSICAEFDKHTSYKRITADKQTLLFKIFSYVEKNFKEDCSLATLAASVGYNAEYVSRFFKSKMGISYNDYVNMRRLNHAAHLIGNTDQTMLACALESGYSSLRSFNRNFKEYYGVTPHEYKKGARKKQ